MGAQRGGRRGLLITVEGVEGSGKTTQCARLAKRLREAGHRVLETREPGGTPLAERIRSLFLGTVVGTDPAEPITPECEALLVFACRSQHVRQVIEPAIREGTIVLCDRFVDSTLAYQGYGRRLDVKTLRTLNRFVTNGLAPVLTLLFDLPAQAGLARRRRNELELNRLDREAKQFHERVRRGFLALAALEPRRVKVLDARADPDQVEAAAWTLVQRCLAKHQKVSKS
ncbi:MAG: dTMP kinase [Nitrospirae bacterium]|nr:MAG: dTMP kinase [Nitrospirota bacterium]